MKKLFLSLSAFGFALTVSGAKITGMSVDYEAKLVFSKGYGVVSQPNPYNQHTRPDSSKGYWKLHTDYNTRMTHVRFYSSQNELLYQEKIKDRYIKLTKRTIRQFDNLLNRLVARNLVVGRVKSYDILVSNQWNAIPQPASSRLEESSMPAPVASSLPTIDLQVVSNTQVRLSYLNPASKQLLITIANESYEYFYKRKSTLKEYAGLLNISHLPSGTYRFEVDGGKKVAQYQLTIDRDTKSLKVKLLLNQFSP